MLETMIQEAGHECIFLPKFHCEVNSIEMVSSLYLLRYSLIYFLLQLMNKKEDKLPVLMFGTEQVCLLMVDSQVILRSLHSPTYSGRILARIPDSNWNFRNLVGTFLAVIICRQNYSR